MFYQGIELHDNQLIVNIYKCIFVRFHSAFAYFIRTYVSVCIYVVHDTSNTFQSSISPNKAE